MQIYLASILSLVLKEQQAHRCQRGFCAGKSLVIILLEFFECINRQVNRRNPAEIFCIAFQKAFVIKENCCHRTGRKKKIHHSINNMNKRQGLINNFQDQEKTAAQEKDLQALKLSS